jgi:signal transduction histidine kinase
MKGFNKDWVYSGSERLATYTQLDPGEYTFRVKGSNGDGVWNEKGTSVKIVVTPPWWKTWWFRFPFLLACISAGSYLYNRRVSGLKKEKLVQQRFSHMLIESQEAERKRIARELHDGIGQSLLIIKNDAQSLLRSLTGESKQATDRLTELSSTASEAIDEIREITSDLRPFLIDKFGLAEAVRSFIDRATHVSDIRFSTTADSVDGCLTKECEMSAYRLIQESVNNIIKHSAATEASILLQRKDGHVLIVVRDNGKGFEVAEASSAGRRGFGLHSISERVRILNGTLTLDSAPGQGTTVKVEIPCA